MHFNFAASFQTGCNLTSPLSVFEMVQHIKRYTESLDTFPHHNQQQSLMRPGLDFAINQSALRACKIL